MPEVAEDPSESDEVEDNNDFRQDAVTDPSTSVESQVPFQQLPSGPLNKVAERAKSVASSQPCPSPSNPNSNEGSETPHDDQYWSAIFEPFPEAFKEHVFRQKKSMTKNFEAL